MRTLEDIAKVIYEKAQEEGLERVSSMVWSKADIHTKDLYHRIALAVSNMEGVND